MIPAARGQSLAREDAAPHPALGALVAQYNVSPKLAHSGNPADLALPAERLAAWAADERAAFKFVVSEPDDLDEVLALAAAHAIPRGRIWLMKASLDGTVSLPELDGAVPVRDLYRGLAF